MPAPRFDRIDGLAIALEATDAPLPIGRATVDAAEWTAAAEAARASGRLVALWGGTTEGGDPAVHAAYAFAGGLAWITLALAPSHPDYPDVSRLFPAALRMQRAARDLAGVVAAGSADQRPWLRHDAWPAGYFPLRRGEGESSAPVPAAKPEPYRFVTVEGDGVHEIAVGPVHAGIIEPGHFRFSVVGEKVLRLEERLGYVHKGIEQLMERTAPLDAHRIAGRACGDSTVAYAWATCMALEAATGVVVPDRAAWLRGLLLERERVANHLGDLGALANDVALAFGLAQFSRLREDWLRLNGELFGHRLLMDRIVPGGTCVDLDAAAAARLAAQCDALEPQVERLHAIFEEHPGLQDRFIGTGRVATPLATRLGLCGLAGRASGIARDLRADHPHPPYDRLAVRAASAAAGDVAARAEVRFAELRSSLQLIRDIARGLPQGARLATVGDIGRAGAGAGWVEGWRGEILVALQLAPSGAIRRCHLSDPSWRNWPVLEHAVIDNIVPDFPLINKSFNLSYSGHDL